MSRSTPKGSEFSKITLSHLGLKDKITMFSVSWNLHWLYICTDIYICILYIYQQSIDSIKILALVEKYMLYTGTGIYNNNYRSIKDFGMCLLLFSVDGFSSRYMDSWVFLF